VNGVDGRKRQKKKKNPCCRHIVSFIVDRSKRAYSMAATLWFTRFYDTSFMKK